MSLLKLNKVVIPATPAADKSVIFMDTDTERIRMVDDTGTVVNLTDDGLRGWNAIINGEFDYAQRQAPGTLTTYSNTSGRAYSADRFAITNENTSVQYIRTDTATTPETNLQSRMYGTFSKITTTGKIVVSQVLESNNCLHLRGRRIRVQFKMKSSSAKTMRLVLLQLANAGTIDTMPATFVSAFGANTVDPTFGTNLAAITPVSPENATVRNNGIDCATTTAWQRFGAIFTLPTNFKNLVFVVFTDSQFVAADSFSMSEVGLYDGPEIRQWVPRQQAEQLAICQRYFCKSFNVDVNPAQNAGLAGAVKGVVTVAGAAASVDAGIRFPVNMRIAPPTLVFFNPSAANAFLRNTTAATDATATSGTSASEAAVEVTATGLAAWALGQGSAVHYTADAEI